MRCNRAGFGTHDRPSATRGHHDARVPLPRSRHYGHRLPFSCCRLPGPLRVGGAMAWLLWLLVHLAFLTGFKNRAATVARWAIAFLGRGRPERTITSNWSLLEHTGRRSSRKRSRGDQPDETAPYGLQTRGDARRQSSPTRSGRRCGRRASKTRSCSTCPNRSSLTKELELHRSTAAGGLPNPVLVRATFATPLPEGQ